METLEAIQLRRSVRRYLPDPVSDRDLETILQAGLSAPSGLNLQPWYFLALKSPEKRQELLDIMERVGGSIGEELSARFQDHPEVIAETTQFIRTLGNAPVILLVFLMRDDYADPRTALISASAAVENAILAARDLGIGSCWLTAANQTGYDTEVRDHFAPGKGELVATVTLGYPAKWPAAVARRKERWAIL